MQHQRTSRTIFKKESLTMGYKVFLIWTVVLYARPQDFLTFLEPFRIGLLFTAIALATAIYGPKRLSLRALLKTGISRKYAILYLLMFIGIPFADHSGRAFDWVVMIYPVNMIYFFLAVFHLDTIKKIKQTAYVLCLSVLFYAVFGLLNGSYVEGRYAVGTMYDPNDLALFMVGLFPISILFLGKVHNMKTRVVAVATLAIAPLIVIMSGSRGGFVCLAVVLLILFMTQVGGIRRSRKIGAIALVAVTIFIFREQMDIERYTTLLTLEEDYNVTSDTGRLQVWESAFKLIFANPITGVGVRCFPRAFGYLRLTEGRVPDWKAAHNAYIQVWTEVGFPGILVFMGIIAASVRSYWRMSRWDAVTSEQKDLKLLGSLMLTGFWGHLIGAFFLSQAYGMQFTLFFAMAAVFRQLAMGWAAEKASETSRSQPGEASEKVTSVRG